MVAATLAFAVAGALVLAEPHAASPRGGAFAIGTATAAELTRDAALQAKIAAVASAATDEQRTAALVALRSASSPDFADLVPQLALFLLDADGERAGMTPALIVSRLGISRGQILRAVEPHLDTADPALRAQLENLLGAVELDDVRALLREQRTPPSPELVRYVFARAPADAVAVFGDPSGDGARGRIATVEQTRAALAAGRAGESDRARAARALDELARDPAWPLRAYAAQILRTQPDLAAADGATLARLAGDAEPRVQSIARPATTSTAR